MYSDIQRKERQPEISQLQGWCFSFNICLNVDGQKVGECLSVFMYNAVSILDFFFSQEYCFICKTSEESGSIL